MLDRIAATVVRLNLTARGARLGVAVSGGADSVFLLHALRDLGFAAVALHVNHKLRGPASDGDEAFVMDLARRLEIPFRALDAPLPAGNLEQEARRLRYEFFASCIAGGDCDAVATGHTLDDQAETVLYRFLRGASTAGLSGILPATESGIVRPLLEIRREEIRKFLTERNIPWREDHSNSTTEFARNRIRLSHMPELAASLNPSLPEVLASTAAWARAEEQYWSSEVDRLECRYLIYAPDETQETILIETGPFRELPLAVQRRLLRRAILRVRGSLRAIDFRHGEAILTLMNTTQGSGRIQLPGLDIYRSFDWLRLAPVGIDSRLPRDFETPLRVPGITEIPERGIAIETELVGRSDVYTISVQDLDWARCSGSLSLRNWRPGDQYQGRGRFAADKIKTLFQEFRVPLWERRTWPVIALSPREEGHAAELSSGKPDSILWTRKFGVADNYAAGPGSRVILAIRELRESKWAAAASNPVCVSLNEGGKRARSSQFRQTGEPGAEVS